jgi:hypothetical protein
MRQSRDPPDRHVGSAIHPPVDHAGQPQTAGHPQRTRAQQPRRFLRKLIDLILNGTIDPGKVFDLTLPLDQVAERYRAMDERRAIKTLLQV